MAATTHGALNDEAVRLIMLFAHHGTHSYFSERMPECILKDGKYTKTFLGHRARFFYRYKARISLAVARAAGTRGSLIRGPTLVKGLKKVNLSELEYGEDLPMGPGHA